MVCGKEDVLLWKPVESTIIATCRVLVEEGLLAFPNPGEGAGRSDDPMLLRV